ncbi:hypothetical protein T4C_2377 [Trichinella pseudospiralis]|uniref:Uncharacterized protein n=1 Tax=Trichinella pseudospiralis TaxID=6337 RepID=A0A0V0WPZ2_TRIPS|nr:hypothetical protein T4E_3020 [Trichinella pseudospiralis]KRY98075.1 hypothetical protein T4C_2377 [Trichinella pseudospiralis]
MDSEQFEKYNKTIPAFPGKAKFGWHLFHNC